MFRLFLTSVGIVVSDLLPQLVSVLIEHVQRSNVRAVHVIAEQKTLGSLVVGKLRRNETTLVAHRLACRLQVHVHSWTNVMKN